MELNAIVVQPDEMQISSTINPAPWLIDAFGAGDSAAGVQVNAGTTLTSGAFYSVITLLANDLAQLWIDVIEHAPRDRKSDREINTRHPISDIWNWQGNHEMVPFDCRQTLLQSKLLHGNGVGVIQWENGRPVGVYPIDPHKVWPDRLPHDPEGLGPLSRRMVYRVTDDVNGQTHVFFQEEVFHVKMLGNGLWGYSPISLFRDIIGTGLALQQYTASTFRNGARPGGVIEYPKPRMSDETKTNLREEWDMLHRGVGNAGRVGILVDGMKFNAMQVTNQEAQLIELGDQYVEVVARIYQTPPSKLQQLKDMAVRANLTELNRQYMQQALMPHATQWEQESVRKLTSFTERDRRRVSCHHDFRDFLRADPKTQNEAFAVGRQWGWLSANDVLRQLDEPGIGSQGDRYMVPSNMADAETGEAFGSSPQNNPGPPTTPLSGDNTGVAMLVRTDLQQVMRQDALQCRQWLQAGAVDADRVVSYLDKQRGNLARRLRPYFGEGSNELAKLWCDELSLDVQRMNDLGDLVHLAAKWPSRVELIAAQVRV